MSATLPEAVLREEKVLSSSFRELGSKEARAARAADALAFMTSGLLDMVNAYDENFDKEIHQLLIHVVQGEQGQAEAMLKVNPDLLFEKGTATDLSKRTFKNITAFQYALWAMDWRMWRMLLKYMSLETAALQFQELEYKGTQHGKHFSFTPLIEALHTYVENFYGWYRAKNYTAIESYWCRRVGGAQLLLPAHVAQEYCHSSRRFLDLLALKASKFKEEERGESLVTVNADYGGSVIGNWYDAECNGGKLGKAFAYARGGNVGSAEAYRYYIPTDIRATQGEVEEFDNVPEKYYPAHDAEALYNLSKIRQKQLLSLENDLSTGYSFCLMSNLKDNRPENGKLYVEMASNAIHYRVADPSGKEKSGLTGSITCQQLGISTMPLTVNGLNPYLSNILKITSKRDHTLSIQKAMKCSMM